MKVHNLLKVIVLILFSDLISMTGYSQTKTLHGKDSSALNQTTKMLRKMDSTHRADSVRRVALLKEIEELKGTGEQKKRHELLQRLKNSNFRIRCGRPTN